MDRVDWTRMMHYTITDLMNTALDWAWAKGYNEAYNEGYGDGHKDGVNETVTTITE